jgi:hypothetical protein
MMSKMLFAVLAGGVLLTAGCVETVTGGKTAGVPFVRDTFENRYRESPDRIFVAAKEVIKADGVLTDEGIKYNETNAVKVVQGRVNERAVYVRIVPVDEQVTSVAVQARTRGGGADMDVAHQVAMEIALKLSERR